MNSTTPSNSTAHSNSTSGPHGPGGPGMIKAPPECYSSDPFIKQGCREACTYKTCPPSLSYWSYSPSLVANGFYLGFFILSLFVFLATNVARKRAFMSFSVIMVLGNVLEIVGYGGRILAHDKPFSPSPFLMQIIGLTLAPAFYAAAIYFCLSRIVTIVGAQNSRIPPSRYPRIFIGCDVLALALQAAGGGIAASSKLADSSPTTGANILIAGLSFQVFTMLIFITLVLDFTVRTMRAKKLKGSNGSILQSEITTNAAPSKDGTEILDKEMTVEETASLKAAMAAECEGIRGSKRFRAFLAAWATATLCIFTRCCYRVAELSEGYTGYLSQHQIYFIVLEGAVVVLAVAMLNVFHPAFCLHKMPPKVLH